MTASRWDENQHSSGKRRRHQEDLAVSHLNNQTIHSTDYGKKKQSSRKKQEEEKAESSALSTSRMANREVLSNLCDKIQSVSGLMNGHVRRMFNLEAFVEPIYDDECSQSQYSDEEERVQLLPKKRLMRKLEEFDNLINAMGALFYASKRM